MVAGHGQGHGQQGPPPVRHGLETWLKEKLERRERISFQENLCEHQKEEIPNLKVSWCRDEACDDFSIASGQCWMDHYIFQLRVSNANTSWVRVKSYTSEG